MSKLSTSFYSVRTKIWNYPDVLFFSKKSWAKSLKSIYKNAVPFSHFIFILLLSLVVFLYGNANILNIVGANTSILIEGSVMGADENGRTIKLNRINPLINSNIQLERDLSELIYEPLIRVDSNGEAHSILAEYSILQKGSSYRFKLKPDIKWHDGEPVTVDDVVKTVELIRSLDDNPQTSSLYSKVANKFDIKTSELDPNVFEFVVKNNQVIPGFFEAISFKIMPAHLLNDINQYNITQPDPYINRTPVGTGPYKLVSAEGDTVNLTLNTDYWDKLPVIKDIRFKLFSSEATAIQALGSGQIHGLTSISITNLDQLKTYDHVETIRSNYIYNQYWSIYFNMSENGPAALKEMKVRQAISSAINREEIIETMQGFAEIAKGPIPPNSFAYHEVDKYGYDVAKAVSLLDEAGYVVGTDGIRAKGDTRLSFELVLVKNSDRAAIAEVIKENLKLIGIEVVLKEKDIIDIVDNNILPRIYDLLFYGVQTLVDPDRYELFHSSQITAPGLNISSYVSEEKRTQVVDGKTAKLPAIDDDLDDARRIVDEAARTKRYEDFQKIISEETPEAFLFYPEEFYLINKRLKNVVLEDINSIEERFNTIAVWKITVTD